MHYSASPPSLLSPRTGGWLQGRGTELLRQIVSLTSVAHVVLLHAPQLPPPALDLHVSAPQVHVHTLPSVTRASSAPSPSAAQLRSLTWRWHVLSAPLHWLPLTTLTVRGLPSCVASHVPSSTQRTLLALNSTVVALEAVEGGVLGLALVRGVDALWARVLLQTPVSPAALVHVHTLHATAIDLLDQERGTGAGAHSRRAQAPDHVDEDEEDEREQEHVSSETPRAPPSSWERASTRRAYRSAHVLAQFSQGHARGFVERAKYAQQ